MVGVAGRSRGCKTCRRRKKGCDLREPICGNCERTKNTCEYDRRQVFINTTGPGGGKETPLAGLVTSSTDVALPHSLARSAYEEKYLGLFWNVWFPAGQLSADLAPRYPVSSWISSARDLYRHDSALRRTLLAMCLSTLGRREERPELMADGFKLYVQALSDVNASLRHPKRFRSDAVMVASRGLGLYELLYGTEDFGQAETSQVKSWHGHNLGELAIIQQRGPAAYLEGHAHDLFAEGRMHLAIAACMSRKRTFLSDDAWKTIPWTKVLKTPKDSLLDILTDIPVLLEEADLLKNDPRTSTRQRFLEAYQRLDTEMVWWLDNLAPPYQTLAALRERNFSSPSADELAVAHVMTHFWAACILVYSTLRSSLPHLAAEKESLELAQRTDPRPYCLDIANTVEAFFQPEAGTFGMHAAPFPLGMAIRHLMFTEGLGGDCMRLIAYFSRGGGGEAMGRFLVNSLPEWTNGETIPMFE
ncbi:hypothetical protein CSOJ01_12035 [Colletotrichum sojae]|uniref:Zn(2)-C6 fungal-type domain-containing protein n=1 Tax=Colletotrichum sojae TaxID=2175907 RepID=A0A8H6IWR2_9PEZI|nr:hypothetical protein CSOJ01_12035 [Colletotrichum sojae]